MSAPSVILPKVALVALKEESRRHKIQIEMQAQTIKATLAERDRLREALEEIAGKSRLMVSEPVLELARAALKGGSDE